MLFYLAYKNIISRKSSVVIILFIAFSLSLMTVINSIFDSTENGVEKVFARSFTGDFVVRPKTDVPLSLFGDETPVTGEMTDIDTLIPYKDLKDFLQNSQKNPDIEKTVPQVTGQVMMEVNSERNVAYVFGVPADSYLDLMTSIEILEGESFGDNGRGVLLSQTQAQSFKAKVGDTVQFIVADGVTFRIRAANVTGIYKYPVENNTLNKIVLADSYTVRSLMGFSETVENIELDDSILDILEGDIESLFADAEDIDSDEAIDMSEFFNSSSAASETVEKTQESAGDFSESLTWNFFIGSVKAEKDIKKTIFRLNRFFKKNNWPLEAVSWRSAAGSTAMYLYWLRIIFNVGVIIILFAGFIIINNTLVVGVLNRTQEIGTLRAEGASRVYISLQCMIETFILTLSAGILGCILGSVISAVLTVMKIELGNDFLIQLFGTNVLAVKTSLSVILRSMGLSVILGLIGWIYPVRTALKVTPVQAMQGAS